MNEVLTNMWRDDRSKALEILRAAATTTRGNISEMSRQLHLSMSTLMRWAGQDEELDKAIRYARADAVLRGGRD